MMPGIDGGEISDLELLMCGPTASLLSTTDAELLQLAALDEIWVR
jgi:hypothetical protein